MKTVYLILQDIRSVHNVGSVFRTADAVGVVKLFLCGCTPTPVDRFGRKRTDMAKVALGAEEGVAWEYVESVEGAIQKCREIGAEIVAVEQTENATPYTEYSVKAVTAFVLGEETKGLPGNIIKLCDKAVEIPMRREKESLNVSVAAGVVLFGCMQ